MVCVKHVFFKGVEESDGPWEEAPAQPGSLTPHAAVAFARGQKGNGWVESLALLVTLFRQCFRDSSCGGVREIPITFSAVLITLWSDSRSEVMPLLYQIEILLVRTLSIVLLQNVVRTGGGRFYLLNHRRKCSCCCALLMREVVFAVHVRSSVMCTPRHLVLLINARVLLLTVNGVCIAFFFLQSGVISVVLLTFNDSLLLLHQATNWFTSSMQVESLSLLMRPTTVVSSTNLMIQFELYWA